MSGETLRERLEVQAYFGLPSPALVEKDLYVAKALAAALLAEGGFSGPESPIEGRYGFAAVTSDSADLALIADGIGQRWEAPNNAYKPYPCGVVLSPVIDACLELRARLTPEMEAIDRVVVRGHPLMRERTDRPNVESGRDARISLQHTVAAAFLFAAAGLAQYEDDCVADPAVRPRVPGTDSSQTHRWRGLDSNF